MGEKKKRSYTSTLSRETRQQRDIEREGESMAANEIEEAKLLYGAPTETAVVPRRYAWLILCRWGV